MMVLIVESVSPSLRGELTRWLLEAKAGVFVGRVSGMVRERLWRKVCQKVGEGSCMIIWSTNTEQGFQIDFFNPKRRFPSDWEGLQLITILNTEKKKEIERNPQ